MSNDSLSKSARWPQRTATVALTVRQADGTLLRQQEVRLAQKSHRFLFGSTGGDLIGLANAEVSGAARARAERLQTQFMELFNFVTLPFYWGRFEPQRGQPDTRRLRRAAEWFGAQGCRVKGHPLCWHTACADWLLPLANAEILQLQLERIRREVTHFAGLIDTWDVINEVVIMPIFDKYDNGLTRLCRELGRLDMIRRVFEAARVANPRAILLLNDFDVSPAFDILVEGCLAAGIPIDVIGIQSHMYQGYWGEEKTRQVLANFERFKLPLHFTESTLVSGHLMPPEIVDLNDYRVTEAEWPTTPEGEEHQAQELVRHYQTLLAHPLVEAVTWWGMPDGGWLNAPSGLVRKDASPKPAYAALKNLIKGEWWVAPTRLATDDAGQLHFSGFLGEYEIAWADRQATFQVEQKGAVSSEVRL